MKTPYLVNSAAVATLAMASTALAATSTFVPGMDEAEAAYTLLSRDGLTRTYVSSQVAIPFGLDFARTKECNYFGKAGGGAHCVKLAGGGAFGELVDVKFYWRPAGQGHSTQWSPCVTNSGCRAFNHEVYPNGRTVATFMINWLPDAGPRDLRMDLIYKSVPRVAEAKPRDDYQTWESTKNRTGKYN